jgi:hypothetical protein
MAAAPALLAARDALTHFLRDESGTATADFIVMTASAGLYAGAFVHDTVGGSLSHQADDIQLCMKRQGKILTGQGRNGNLSYQERLAKVSKRCSKV